MQTGKIPPQFHIVFNDWFLSVASIGCNEAFNPTLGRQLFSNFCYQYIFNADEAICFSDKWLHQDLNHMHQHQNQCTAHLQPHPLGSTLQRETTTPSFTTTSLINPPDLPSSVV